MMIEWNDIKEGWNCVEGNKGVRFGLLGGKKIFTAIVTDKDGPGHISLYFFGNLAGIHKTFTDAKAKAEELLTEWLTTAIKDLPEEEIKKILPGWIKLEVPPMFCPHGGFGESCIVCYPK